MAVIVAVSAVLSAATTDAVVRPAAAERRAAPQAGMLAWPSTAPGRSPSVSGEGRYVAFLGPSDDGRTETVLLLDRARDLVTDVLPLPADVVPGGSAWPVLSADGCTITVLTELALDRYRDTERGGRWDAYQRRLDHCGGGGQWDLVSGGDGAGLSAAATNDVDPRTAPAVSSDGSKVAYAYRTSDGGSTAVAVVDMRVTVGATGRRRDVTAGSTTTMLEPSLDASGSVLAAAVSSADGTSSRVLVWRLSGSGAGDAPVDVPGEGRSSQPSLSSDGSWLAFVSDAPDVVDGAALGRCLPRCPSQVYLLGLDDGSVQLVSRRFSTTSDDLIAGNGPSSQPAVSESGAEIVFVTRATNFFATRHRILGSTGDGEIVRVSTATGTMRREMLAADGIAPVPRVHGSPAMSSNGRVVAVDSAPVGGTGGRRLAVVEAEPQLDVPDISLGTIPLGFTSSAVTTTLTNLGPSAFAPGSASVDSPDVDIVGGSCVDPLASPVQPGASCTIDVTFSPGSAGPLATTMRLEEDFEGGVVREVAVRGIGGDALLRATPNQLAVEQTAVGAVGKPSTVIVQNVSGGRLRPTAAVLVGDHAGDFRIVADGCAGERLTDGGTCRIEVVFAPTGQGRRTADLVVADGRGASVVVPMSGAGSLRPSLSLSGTMRSRAGDDVPLAITGRPITVTGAGFAPSTQVLVSWGDGIGRWTWVTTDASGAFRVRVVVLRGERVGTRLLVASALGYVVVQRVRIVQTWR